MNLEFDKSFARNLEKINDKSIQKKLIKIIELVENANSISEIANTKKLVGYFSY
jgi:mRNA-degrading endonuclease RelE of RelBE toxin-antitoxin system